MKTTHLIFHSMKIYIYIKILTVHGLQKGAYTSFTAYWSSQTWLRNAQGWFKWLSYPPTER